MIWSSKRISISSHADLILRVRLSSCPLGRVLPDGWLWARTIAVALPTATEVGECEKVNSKPSHRTFAMIFHNILNVSLVQSSLSEEISTDPKKVGWQAFYYTPTVAWNRAGFSEGKKKKAVIIDNCFFSDPPGEIVRNLCPDNQKIMLSNFCISNIWALYGLHRCSLFCVQGNVRRYLFAHQILQSCQM